MTTSYKRASASLIVIGLAALLMLLVLSGGAGPASGAEVTATTRSTSLVAAPGLDRQSTVRFADGAQSREAAARAAARVPLPKGGNVNGIRWEELGGASVAEIETFVEYNGFCQWLRASRDPAQRDTALAVLDDVPSWPGFRDQPDDGLIRQIVAEAHAGDGPVFATTVADCDRSHERETAYASKLGLEPSS